MLFHQWILPKAPCKIYSIVLYISCCLPCPPWWPNALQSITEFLNIQPPQAGCLYPHLDLESHFLNIILEFSEEECDEWLKYFFCSLNTHHVLYSVNKPVAELLILFGIRKTLWAEGRLCISVRIILLCSWERYLGYGVMQVGMAGGEEHFSNVGFVWKEGRNAAELQVMAMIRDCCRAPEGNYEVGAC